jgi:hypothetical protein
VWFDDFDDGLIDPSNWSVDVVGSGPTASEINGRLELYLPGSASAGAQGLIRAGYASRCKLRGDFDIRVSYALLGWPEANGTRLGLTSGWSMERTSFGTAKDFPGRPREVYLVDIGGSVRNITATSDVAGALRLTRIGNTLTGYRLEGTSWVAQHSAKGPAGDLPFSIAAWSDESVFADRDVLAAFDDFILSTGTLVCP